MKLAVNLTKWLIGIVTVSVVCSASFGIFGWLFRELDPDGNRNTLPRVAIWGGSIELIVGSINPCCRTDNYVSLWEGRLRKFSVVSPEGLDINASGRERPIDGVFVKRKPGESIAWIELDLPQIDEDEQVIEVDVVLDTFLSFSHGYNKYDYRPGPTIEGRYSFKVVKPNGWLAVANAANTYKAELIVINGMMVFAVAVIAGFVFVINDVIEEGRAE